MKIHNKIHLWGIGLAFMATLMVSCESEFDKHFGNSDTTTTIDKNIVEILATMPDMTLFHSAIVRLDLESTLGKSALYTCLAPRNEDVQSWIDDNSYGSIEGVPEIALRQWVNYHMIAGMYYRYDIEKRLLGLEADERNYYSANNFTTRNEEDLPGKSIRIYTEDFLLNRGSDYQYITNESPNGFSIDAAPLSEDVDIDAANGVIHVLAGPLEVPLRADLAIAADPSLSIVDMWLDRFVVWDIKGIDDDGKIDTTKVKRYTFGADIAKEGNSYTFMPPTDDAIKDFFGPYLEDNFQGEYDSISDDIVKAILAGSIANGIWGMSDLEKGGEEPYFTGVNVAFTLLENKVKPYYAGGLMSSNVEIYKVNKMLLPPNLHSVEGGILMNGSKYSQIQKIMKYVPISSLLTDRLLYQHTAVTMLVQPDEYWDTDVELDYPESEDKDTLSWGLGVGLLNQKIDNGEFANNTFYNSSYGSLLFNDGVFTDYAGKTANLISKTPTWVGANGSIYEIDEIMNPLSVRDTTQTIYKMHLRNNPDYAIFNLMCELTEVSELLNEFGFYTFTIFAPTDQAIIDAGLDNMPVGDMKAFVEKHIIQRKIFSDGTFSGGIFNLNEDFVTIKGEWDTFGAEFNGTFVKPISTEMNQQANNGVMHGISVVFK